MLKLTFRQKLFLPLILAWFCLLIVFVVSALQNRALRLEERKTQLANAAQMAGSLAGEYRDMAQRGVLAESDAKVQALARIRSLRFGPTGYLTVFDDTKVLMHPIKPEMIGVPVAGTHDVDGRPIYLDSIAAATKGDGMSEYRWPKPGEKALLPKIAYTLHYAPWGWYLLTGLYVDDLDKAFHADLRDAAIWLVVIGAVLSTIVVGLVRSVERSLGGDPDDAVEVARRIAAGDLGAGVDVRAGDTASLMAAMKTMRDALAAIVAQVRTGTDLIATTSREIASGNLDLSGRTEQQAASLEETAASMDELTLTVKHSAEHAREASRLAESAAEVAQRGGVVVSRVVETMASINESSGKVVDIIGVIDGIAFQTNILALNAAVEAARAGEQGRGFAVVAGEVRTLAQRSAAAAKEIKALIGASVARVDDGAKLVAEAGVTMQEIVTSVNEVSTMIGAISNATREQGDGIGHINKAIAQMDQTTQQNAALVEEAAAASESMQEQAAQLAEVVSVFQVEARPAGGRAAGRRMQLA